MDNFQRKNSKSNAHVGSQFESLVATFFESQGLVLEQDFALEIGVANKTKPHKWDFGSHEQSILIECKSHKWTTGDKVPSAKITTWDQAMYYMLLAPNNYRKIFACLRHERESNGETLAKYYIRLRSHLIPPAVEIWEFCEQTGSANRLK